MGGEILGGKGIESFCIGQDGRSTGAGRIYQKLKRVILYPPLQDGPEPWIWDQGPDFFIGGRIRICCNVTNIKLVRLYILAERELGRAGSGFVVYVHAMSLLMRGSTYIAR